MSAHAAPAPSGPVLHDPRQAVPGAAAEAGDPRLHLAAVIISLQVIGQIGFHFELSIAQILLAHRHLRRARGRGSRCARQHVLMWPASAMLTGNGVAFVLRVPGTVHGDWWSLRGWWIYVGTAAVSLLSKYVIRWRGEHIFNPSNIGLVLCFLVLGRTRAAPLDFWWGPMSAWLVARARDHRRRRLPHPPAAEAAAGGPRLLGDLCGCDRRARARRAHDDRAVAPRPDLRFPPLAGPHHLARGARVPLLHDHRPEDGATIADGAGSSTRSRSACLPRC